MASQACQHLSGRLQEYHPPCAISHPLTPMDIEALCLCHQFSGPLQTEGSHMADTIFFLLLTISPECVHADPWFGSIDLRMHVVVSDKGIIQVG